MTEVTRRPATGDSAHAGIAVAQVLAAASERRSNQLFFKGNLNRMEQAKRKRGTASVGRPLLLAGPPLRQSGAPLRPCQQSKLLNANNICQNRDRNSIALSDTPMEDYFYSSFTCTTARSVLGGVFDCRTVIFIRTQSAVLSRSRRGYITDTSATAGSIPD